MIARVRDLPSAARGANEKTPWLEGIMSINIERDIAANLQIGPTEHGMVRLFVEAENIQVPMDFSPEEAEEIAEEILAAVRTAKTHETGAKGGGGKRRIRR